MTLQDAKRTFDAIYRQSNPDKSKTLSAWQQRTSTVRRAILRLKEQHNEATSKYYERYIPKVADQMAADDWESADMAIRNRIDELKSDLQEILDGKRKQFEKVALSAPSEEQLRLLQTVALRDDLTSAEISRIGATMADNFQAMRSLRSIAKRSGIPMIAPPSVEDFEDSLSRAEEFCKDMLYSIQKIDSELGYNDRCFYCSENVGMPKALFEKLDNCLYAAVQMEEGTKSE